MPAIEPEREIGKSAHEGSTPLDVLSHVRVASPCPESWAGMTGDDRVRFCDRCELNVYNLSAMTRPEAESFARESRGRLCIRYYQRADGTILTQNCPVGLRLARQRMAKLVLKIAACIGFMASSLWALAKGPSGSRDMKLRHFQPFASIAIWLGPSPLPQRGYSIMGRPRLPQLTPEEMEQRRHKMELLDPATAESLTEYDVRRDALYEEVEATFKTLEFTE